MSGKLLLLLSLALICACSAHASKPLARWVPDRAFAKAVADANQDNFTYISIVCEKPLVSQKVAATLGLVQEDCLIFASGPRQVFCGELGYQNGPLPPQGYPCTTVAKAFKKDVRPQDIMHFHYPKKKGFNA